MSPLEEKLLQLANWCDEYGQHADAISLAHSAGVVRRLTDDQEDFRKRLAALQLPSDGTGE